MGQEEHISDQAAIKDEGKSGSGKPGLPVHPSTEEERGKEQNGIAAAVGAAGSAGLTASYEEGSNHPAASSASPGSAVKHLDDGKPVKEVAAGELETEAHARKQSGGTEKPTSDSEEPTPWNFPQKLMDILNAEENVDIISWLPHGRGFLIRDKKRFASDVLPKFFSKQSKFTSFTRKLNRWSFTRVTRGPETGAYYHPLFQRDNPRLCLQMSCINAKSPQQLQPMNPIALGLGMTNNFVMPWASHPVVPGSPAPVPVMPLDFNDPTATAAMTEQQRQFFQQQQQQFMAMMSSMQQATPSAAGTVKEESGAAIEEGKQDSADTKSPADQQPDMAAFAAFQEQQRQYYAMFMVQQQHLAMMAAGMNPPAGAEATGSSSSPASAAAAASTTSDAAPPATEAATSAAETNKAAAGMELDAAKDASQSGSSSAKAELTTATPAEETEKSQQTVSSTATKAEAGKEEGGAEQFETNADV